MGLLRFSVLGSCEPLVTNTEVEEEEGAEEEEEETVEEGCVDEERRDECSLPMPDMPTLPDPPPTRPEDVF